MPPSWPLSCNIFGKLLVLLILFVSISFFLFLPPLPLPSPFPPPSLPLPSPLSSLLLIHHVEVDPNFVVLLGRHDDFCSSSNKSRFNKMLYIAIFAPVGVAILLLVLFIAAYPKFSTWRKLQQARSNDSELSSIKWGLWCIDMYN